MATVMQINKINNSLSVSVGYLTFLPSYLMKLFFMMSLGVQKNCLLINDVVKAISYISAIYCSLFFELEGEQKATRYS